MTKNSNWRNHPNYSHPNWTQKTPHTMSDDWSYGGDVKITKKGIFAEVLVWTFLFGLLFSALFFAMHLEG